MKLPSPDHRSWKTILSFLVLSMGLISASATTRSIESYRIDPLTETRRWNRLDTIAGTNSPLLQIDQKGRLHLIGDDNQLTIFDGASSSEIPLAEGLESARISAFHRTSDGVSCVVGPDSIFLLKQQIWSKVSDHGLSRRAHRNILEIDDGILWIGADAGLVQVNSRTGQSSLTPFPNPVLSICRGPDGKSLWVATRPNGKVWECPLLPNGTIAPPDSWILRRPAMAHAASDANLLRASDGRIWYINSHYTLPASLYDPHEEAWADINLPQIGGDNLAFSILETRDRTILISSRGSLHAYKNNEWTVYRSPEYPLPGATSFLAEDPQGFFYITEAGGTILRIDYANQEGRSFAHLHFHATTGQNELVFISSEDEVLVLAAGSTEATVHPPETTGVSNPVALKIARNGDFFLVGEHQGTAAISIFDGTRWSPQKLPRFARMIGHLGIEERRNGEIWIGCGHEQVQFPDFPGGVLIFTPHSDGYGISHLQPPAVPYRIWSIVEGPEGIVYTNDHGIHQITSDETTQLALPAGAEGKWIDQIAATEGGDLWMALWSVGILGGQVGQWSKYFDANGMGSPRASYMLLLHRKFPVAATQSGIYRFDGNNWAPFMTALGGLHRGSGQLLQGAGRSVWMNHTHVDWYYRGQRSEAYPADKKKGFRTTQYLPTIDPPQTYWIEKPLALIRETSLTVRYGGRDAWARTAPSNLQFSHRINGGNWTPFGPARDLELERLTGGTHTLEVMARNTDFNVQSSPLKAEFTVIIPFWNQAWFLPATIAAVLLFFMTVAFFIRQRVLLLLQIEQVKMRFFTHLSHEIKTPLSLILGPVEKLQNEITDSTHQHSLWLIKSNSQRLLHLVNQLLDFRKLQLKTLEFKAETGDFIPFAKSCISVFQGWAEEKGHDLAFETNLESLVFAFDQEMFHQIIDNLVNNAVKYTPPGGRIRVRVSRISDPKKQPYGLIEVEDHGPGVPDSEKEAVFEPFYRNPALGDLEEGSGIGLAFVKELTTALQGSIDIISPVNPGSPRNPGSCFRVLFPLALDSSHVATASPVQPAPNPLSPPATPPTDPLEDQEAPQSPSQALILLIEDNHDLRTFLTDELRTHFKVESAENAEEGIRLSRELIPDLVISDVVMTGKSGFEASRAIKSHEHTSHIPIILLTALRSEEHKRLAYQSGADDFINKPISSEILRGKIQNLLNTQKNIRDRVRHQFVDDQRITGLADPDQEFLDQVEALVEEQLTDDQFEVSVLAQKLGFSRSAFYRKFKSLTDLSPASYIRTKRLRRAAQWLAQGHKSIIEIAFDVGFSDSSYFSRVFKSEYKCSPSEFAKKGKTGRRTSPSVTSVTASDD